MPRRPAAALQEASPSPRSISTSSSSANNNHLTLPPLHTTFANPPPPHSLHPLPSTSPRPLPSTYYRNRYLPNHPPPTSSQHARPSTPPTTTTTQPPPPPPPPPSAPARTMSSHSDPSASSASNDASKKKSTKKAVSCEPCRRRKLKCDRGWPCGACRDRNESSKCEWAEGVRPQTTGRDTGDSSQVNDRLDRLEAIMGAVAASLGVDLPGAKQSPASASSATPAAAQRKLSTTSSASNTNIASTSKLSTLAELGASEANRAALAATPARSDASQPSLGIGPISWGFGFGISQMNHISSEELTRKTLFELLHLLPENSIVRALTDFYFRELSWMAHLIPEETFRKRLRGVEEQRLFWDGRPDAYRYDEMRDTLRLVATIHALCGAVLVFGEPIEGDSLPERYGKQAFTIFLDAAQHALSVLDIYEELHIDNVRTMVLLSSCLSALKGPAVGSAMMANICFMAYALQLDVEPPKTLPYEERKDRISLFATLCIQDWFSSGNVKRSYIIDPANTSLPSLFGPDAHLNDIVSVPMRYKLKLSDVSRRASHRIRMSEDEAYEFTKQLHQEVVAIEASIPEHLRFDESLIDSDDPDNPERWHRSAMALAVQMQLLTLHKRFYVQSWTNPKYKESRDISFAASMLIIKVFRNAFKWFTPRENATLDEQRAMIGEGMRTQHNSVSRLWFFAQMSIISSLVLIHFVSMLDTHPQESCDWDSSELRAQITDDLKFVRLLLQALSSKSKLALDGARAIQPPESNRHKRKADEAVGPAGSTRGGGPLGSRSMDSLPIRNPSWYSASSGYSNGSTPALTNAQRTPPAYNSPGSSSNSSHSLAHSASASELTRPKLPFDGQVAPPTANSFDDIEALWHKQPWQTASIRMGTSPANPPAASGNGVRGKDRGASASGPAPMGATAGGYFAGSKASGQYRQASSAIPTMATSETSTNPECPYINASFFGPDASFNDLARAEAAIGRQDASYGYPVAPLSPFTASFINSLDQYVASLEEPLPSNSPATLPLPVPTSTSAMPQSHTIAAATATNTDIQSTST